MKPTTPATEPIPPTDLANRVYLYTARIGDQDVICGLGVFADPDQAAGWALETTREAVLPMEFPANGPQMTLELARLNDSQVSAALAQILLLRPDLFDQTFARLNTPE